MTLPAPDPDPLPSTQYTCVASSASAPEGFVSPDASVTGWQLDAMQAPPRQSCPHAPQLFGSVVRSAPPHGAPVDVEAPEALALDVEPDAPAPVEVPPPLEVEPGEPPGPVEAPAPVDAPGPVEAPPPPLDVAVVVEPEPAAEAPPVLDTPEPAEAPPLPFPRVKGDETHAAPASDARKQRDTRVGMVFMFAGQPP
jgi:hypothetical protein